MARLELGRPPALGDASYQDYLPWLRRAFYLDTCAYCLQHRRDLQVDHVEPVSLAPGRRHDPTNLLTACATCNGPGGKWDYHPDKGTRRKCARERHGFLALDPRVDDLAQLYEVGLDGTLDVQPGDSYDRALWNKVVLFRLDRAKLRTWRRQSLDLLACAHQLTAAVHASNGSADPSAVWRRDVIIREVAERWLFYALLEVPVSPEVVALVMRMREEQAPPA